MLHPPRLRSGPLKDQGARRCGERLGLDLSTLQTLQPPGEIGKRVVIERARRCRAAGGVALKTSFTRWTVTRNRRSVLQPMCAAGPCSVYSYFLSQAVDPPASDVEAGFVTVTKDDAGQPFDWTKVTGKVMTIHSSKERPGSAYVAVQHRGSWLYIAADDHSSKATFSLLNTLFSLQAATGRGKSPLLTLPVGR